ncbi:MAG: hypothetical protein ICV62_13030 [Cyanobacteria bacterium Co-bin13]|nr:hypothetical protein [Cyanobacteria bacterium Co-bin13]
MKAHILSTLMISSILLLAGCSGSNNSPNQPTANTPEILHKSSAETVAKEIQVASQEENKLAIQNPTHATESNANVKVRLEPGEIILDHSDIEAGTISFNIENESTGPQEVLLIKTDLPRDRIPTINGEIDLSSSAVKPIAQLANSPMPRYGSEIITRALEPGNYVLMAYTPFEIEAAATTEITLQSSGF